MPKDDKIIYSSSRQERRARERTRSRLQVVLVLVAVLLIGVAVGSFIAFGGGERTRPAGGESASAVSDGESEAGSFQEEGGETPVEDGSREESGAAPAESSSQNESGSQYESGSRRESSADGSGSSAGRDDSSESSGESGDRSESGVESGSSSSESGHVEQIEGKNVYVDTKHKVPETTGKSVTFTAVGETSYGFNWDYETDNKNFQLTCDYVFDTKTYQFTVYGVSPGTSHLNVIYYTADDKTATLPVTIHVDDQLNVTVES